MLALQCSPGWQASTLDSVLAAAQEQGSKWNRSKVMYVGDGRAGKSHLHRNVAGEPPDAALESTVGMDTMTLECRSMRTGQAGVWTHHTRDPDVSEAVLALAKAQKSGGDGDTGTQGESMSDSVDSLLARPASHDAAATAAGQGLRPALATPSAPLATMAGGTPEAADTNDNPSTSAGAWGASKPAKSASVAAKASIDDVPTSEPAPAPADDDFLCSYRPIEELQREELAEVKRLVDDIKFTDSLDENALVLEGWDLGGQRIFMVLHHLYLTRYCLYCVLFDMRQLLRTAATKARKRALGILRFWLNSIMVHTVSGDSEAAQGCAPFVLVGTHKDLVPTAQEHAEISELLYETFGTHPAWPYMIDNSGTGLTGVDVHDANMQKTLLNFFPIDNPKGQADPTFSRLLAAIEHTVRAESYVHRRVPIAWYRTYDELQRVLADGRPTVSFTETVQLASQAGMPVDPRNSVEKEVQALLRFLHELGILMYFNEQGLDDIVVLDPQWLVTATTKMICEFSIHKLPEHTEAQKTMPQHWNALSRKAELNVELLSVFWRDHGTAAQQQLLQLMVKFGLAMPMRQRGVFLLPALLKNSEDAQQQLYEAVAAGGAKTDEQHTAYFVFSLRDQLTHDEAVDCNQLLELGFLPVGFFSRVLGKCVAWSQSTHSAPPQLTQSTAVLAFGGDRFMLNELPDRNAIRIVLLQENVNAAERVSALIQDVISECMPHLCCKLMLPAPPAAGPAGPKHAQLEFAYPPFDTSGHLLPLDLIRTVASAHGEDGRLWSGGKELLGTELHSLYALWLPSMGKLSSYDILLSYRHSAKLDSECVLKVTDGCGSGTPALLFGSSRRRLRVFLDRIRLSIGAPFIKDIMQAMLHSRVVCPVISAAATQRMESMVPPPQSGKVVLFSSSPGWDIQKPPRDVMQMLEALCKSKTGLYMGYDWKGSTSACPDDEDEARIQQGKPPIDWSCNEEGNPASVATSQWFVGYKSKIKSQLVLFAQLPGTAEIECATVDGGAISQLEFRTMPQLLQEATQDIKSKNLPVPKMYIKQRRTVDEVVAEYGSQADIEAFETRYLTKINGSGQAAAKSGSDSTSALDLLLVEWVLAIELEQLGHVLTVLPILIGERTGAYCYHS